MDIGSQPTTSTVVSFPSTFTAPSGALAPQATETNQPVDTFTQLMPKTMSTYNAMTMPENDRGNDTCLVPVAQGQSDLSNGATAVLEQQFHLPSETARQFGNILGQSGYTGASLQNNPTLLNEIGQVFGMRASTLASTTSTPAVPSASFDGLDQSQGGFQTTIDGGIHSTDNQGGYVWANPHNLPMTGAMTTAQELTPPPTGTISEMARYAVKTNPDANGNQFQGYLQQNGHDAKVAYAGQAQTIPWLENGTNVPSADDVTQEVTTLQSNVSDGKALPAATLRTALAQTYILSNFSSLAQGKTLDAATLSTIVSNFGVDKDAMTQFVNSQPTITQSGNT